MACPESPRQQSPTPSDVSRSVDGQFLEALGKLYDRLRMEYPSNKLPADLLGQAATNFRKLGEQVTNVDRAISQTTHKK